METKVVKENTDARTKERRKEEENSLSEKAMSQMTTRASTKAKASPQTKERQMLQAVSQLQTPNIQMPPMVRLGTILHMEIQIPRLVMPGMRSIMTVQQEELGTQKMA